MSETHGPANRRAFLGQLAATCAAAIGMATIAPTAASASRQIDSSGGEYASGDITISGCRSKRCDAWICDNCNTYCRNNSGAHMYCKRQCRYYDPCSGYLGSWFWEADCFGC